MVQEDLTYLIKAILAFIDSNLSLTYYTTIIDNNW